MKLTDDQIESIRQATQALHCQYAALAAVVQTESNGIVGEIINGRLEPIVRYEGHYFDKLCDPAKRAAARAAGVSAPEAGQIKNPKDQRDRWKLILKAASIDANAAYQSVSYGIGQVMGSNWKKLGFSSVQELVTTARSGFAGQLKLMVQYILNFGLADELQALDWSGFARGYNGPNFKKYKYDTNLQAAYLDNGGASSIASNRSGYLRLGSTGAGVRDVQALLRSAGYNVLVDGDFGTSTKNAVMAFQKNRGMKLDGIIGPETQQALSVFRENAVAKPGQMSLFSNPTVQKAVAVGVGSPTLLTGAKNTVQGYIDQLGPYSFLAPIVDKLSMVVGILTVAAIVSTVCVVVYKWRQSKHTDTGTKVDDLVPINESDDLVLPTLT